jgi:hypothetical protein
MIVEPDLAGHHGMMALFLTMASRRYCAMPSKRSIQSGFASSISRIFQSRRHFLNEIFRNADVQPSVLAACQ